MFLTILKFLPEIIADLIKMKNRLYINVSFQQKLAGGAKRPRVIQCGGLVKSGTVQEVGMISWILGSLLLTD